MTLSPADIKLIVQALQESDWDQAEVVVGEVRIAVGRGSETPVPAPVAELPADTGQDTTPAAATTAPVAAPPAAPVGEHPAPAPDTGTSHVVTAPSVGVFWRAPAPGEQPFVEVGQKVAPGDTVGIVEVMKLMNNVTTEVGGVVTAIHADNAQSVEFGTPLVSIQPES